MYYEQNKQQYDQYGNPLVNDTYQSNQAVHSHVTPLKPSEPVPTGWRDVAFAILFYINVIAMVGLMVVWGIPTITESTSKSTSSDEVVSSKDVKTLLAICAGFCVLAAAISLMIIRIVVKYAKGFITFALWFNVVLSFLVALAAFAAGSIIFGVIGLVFACLSLWYAFSVRNRIPFATANLQTAASAVKTHSSLNCVALVVVLFQVAWIMIWSIAAIGITNETQKNKETPNGLAAGQPCRSGTECQSGSCVAQTQGATQGECSAVAQISAVSGVAYFFMLLSFYWGIQVIKNVSHVTVAGTVASWWFNVESKGSTGGALKRSLTTSFGSICFGSLIVAIIQTIKQMVEQARGENGGGIAECIIICILDIIERLLEYFNRWAFVYVGVYGYKFTTAGKAVITLFKQRGFEAIINDDLIGNVLSLTSFVIGLLCGGIGVGLGFASDNLLDMANGPIFLGVLGFLFGFGVSLIPLSVIDSSVATVFVCFTEDPAALSRNRPELYGPMVNAWQVIFPSAMANAGY